MTINAGVGAGEGPGQSMQKADIGLKKIPLLRKNEKDWLRIFYDGFSWGCLSISTVLIEVVA